MFRLITTQARKKYNLFYILYFYAPEGTNLLTKKNFEGERHGTVTARINDKISNTKSPRFGIDKVTDGRHAEVEFVTDWKIG